MTFQYIIVHIKCISALALVVDTVAKKISRKLGFLKRLKLYLNSHLLNTVYISLIQSQFDYCLTVWGSCSKYFYCYVYKGYKIEQPASPQVYMIIMFLLLNLLNLWDGSV